MTDEVYLLPEDRQWATARIAELEQMIQDLGPEFQEAFTQSSETWHDNAPFEAVRDKQSLMSAELHQLRVLIRRSTLTPPRRKRGKVNIGDIVTVSNGKRYRIAGDWTHRAGKHDDGVTWVSRHAPLAVSLLGKSAGESVSVGTKSVMVEHINTAT